MDKKFKIIATNKITKLEKILDITTEQKALNFCECWGWTYDDGKDSYYLNYYEV